MGLAPKRSVAVGRTASAAGNWRLRPGAPGRTPAVSRTLIGDDTNAPMTISNDDTPTTAALLTVKVWRGAKRGAFARYDVPRQASQTVLDVVTHIQRHLDPTLSYRFACRVGMCGSCAMTVNGKRALDLPHARRQGGGERRRLEIAPLAQPARRSRTWSPTCASSSTSGRAPRASSSGTATRHDDFASVKPDSPARAPRMPASSASAAASATRRATWWRGDRDYLGPAALNRAWTLVNDVRDVRRSASGCVRSRATPAAILPHAMSSAPSVARSSSRPRWHRGLEAQRPCQSSVRRRAMSVRDGARRRCAGTGSA